MALALGVAPEAVGSGGAATETAGAASTMVAPTAASINGATAANHECKQVSAFMCTPMRLYGRDVHVWAGVGGLTFARVAALAVLQDPPSPVPRLGPV